MLVCRQVDVVLINFVAGLMLLLGLVCPVMAAESVAMNMDSRIIVQLPTGDRGRVRAVAIFSYYSPAGGPWMRNSAGAGPVSGAGYTYGFVDSILRGNGVATIALNPMGFRCSASLAEDANDCYDNQATSALTMQDWVGALEQMVRRAGIQFGDSVPIIFVSFSAASIPVGKWLELNYSGDVGRYAWLGLSPLLTSPRMAMHQQQVSSFVNLARSCKGGNDNDCRRFERRWEMLFHEGAQPYRDVLDGADGINRFEQALEGLYAQGVDDLSMRAANESSPPMKMNAVEGDFLLASPFVMEFTYGKYRPYDILKYLEGRIHLIFGTDDLAFDPVAQMEWARSIGFSGEVDVVNGAGHGLGPNPGFGAISAEARPVLDHAVRSLLSKLSSKKCCH